MTEVLMQPVVPCNDKLVGGIDDVSTDAVNFVVHALLSIDRKLVPIEFKRLDLNTFIVEASSFIGGPSQFFKYSKIDNEQKLEPLPITDIRPTPSSELQKSAEVSYNLLRGIGLNLFQSDAFGPSKDDKKNIKSQKESNSLSPKKESTAPTIKKNNPCPVAMDKLFWPDFDKLKKK
jgi:hypothetical protein